MSTLLTMILLNFAVPAMAEITSDPILDAEVVKTQIADFETSYSVDCIAPKATQIHWMCTNGDGCGFLLDITCVSRIGTFESNDKIMRLSIFGEKKGSHLSFSPTYNRTTTYKKLQAATSEE